MQVDKRIASVVKPGSPGAGMAFMVRKNIYRKLAELIKLDSQHRILDVGVTPDDSAYSNFFEHFYPDSSRITALSDQDASSLEKVFPGLKFVRGDGRDMPFADNEFDLVFSSAVLEHVGSYQQQKSFIAEAVRVSSKYVFLTTPNRWHPLEFHTYLPLLHWLPKKWHRRILKMLKLEYLSKEENLNLLDKCSLQKICRELGVEYRITFVRFLGIRSNLLLLISK